jgi:hypothetical protein
VKTATDRAGEAIEASKIAAAIQGAVAEKQERIICAQ